MPSLRKDGTKRFGLSDEQFTDLARELELFRRHCAAPVTCLTDSSGLLLSKAGKAKDKALVLLATLAAANNAASLQMAKLLGEKEGFKSQCYEGERFSVFLQEVPDDYLLVTVFAKNSPLSIVQHFSNRYVPKFQQILWRTSDDESYFRRDAELKSEISNREFEDELNEKLSRVLTR